MTVPPPRGRLERPLSWISGAPELMPGMLALLVFFAWSASEGGFPVTSSGPGGLFLIGALVASAIGYRERVFDLPPVVKALIGLLAGYVAWSFLSINWAEVQGDAWDGANRTLIYFTVFSLFAIIPWRASSAAIVFGTWAAGVAAIGVISVVVASQSSEPITAFVSQRFAEPTGYHNANAALFGFAFWPAIVLAAQREVPWPLRGAMLGTAGVLFQLALLPQSRGWLVAFPLAALLAIAVVPGRARLIATSVPLAIVVFVFSSPILDLFEATNEGGDVGAGVDAALEAILLTGLVLLVVGVAAGILESLLRPSERMAKLGGRAIGAGVTAAAVIAAVLAIGATGNPIEWVDDRWDDFRSGEPEQGFSGSRLGDSLGSGRYDYWRVSVDAWTEKPLLGLGADNFAVDYLRERKTFEEPLHPHSLPIRILTQGGVVGAALLGAFFLVATAVLARLRMQAPSPHERVIGGVVVVAAGYWLLHSAGDWFWTFPAISAPAFALLGLGAGIGRRRDPVERAGTNRRAMLLGPAGAVALLAGASLAFPLAARIDVEKAANGWAANPTAAFERLDRAADTNPLSVEASLVEGAIAVRLDDRERVRAAFTEVLERDPVNWYALLELGALEALEGNTKIALNRFREARLLNPREPLIAEVAKRARRGRPTPLQSIGRELLERVCTRLGRTSATDYCAN